MTIEEMIAAAKAVRANQGFAVKVTRPEGETTYYATSEADRDAYMARCEKFGWPVERVSH